MRRSRLLLLIHLLLLRVALQWHTVGTSAFQSVISAVPTPLPVAFSALKSVRCFGETGWKQTVFPLILFRYWK